MFFHKNEAEFRKIVWFYSIYNCVYFPLFILALFWTNSIYSIGKYKFASYIALILLSEFVKFSLSSIYVKTKDVNLGKKYGERTVPSIMVFAWTNFKDGFKKLVVTFLLMAVYFIISILYGAEVFNKHEETLMFSNLLSVLTVFSTSQSLGSQSVLALLMGSKPVNKLETLLQQNLSFTLFGAWIGCFVIPLDWDRPWQVWPIPCSLGALIGYALSHFVILFQLTFSTKKKNKKYYLFQK